jgi:hypothetical protein
MAHLKRVQEAVALLLILSGLGHAAATLLAYEQLDGPAMWFMSAGLMMIFLGFLNLAAAGAQGAVRRLSLLTVTADVAAALFVIPLYLAMRATAALGLMALVIAACWLELRTLRASGSS